MLSRYECAIKGAQKKRRSLVKQENKWRQ